MSDQGTKHDQNKPIISLIPSHAIEQEGLVFTFGSKKYGDYNWTNGINYSRLISAAMRHLLAINRGEDLDPESGLPHAAHVRANMAMLLQFQVEDRTQLDNRYKGKQ